MRSTRRALWVLVALALLLAGYLWVTMLSPFTYSRPDHLAEITEGQHEVFVYGTLRYASVRWVVYGRAGDPEEARLPGYRREGLDLAREENAYVEGLLLEVDEQELARLDRYERLGIRYRRELLVLENGNMAWVYLRL
ncbi:MULTISPECIES: gamma-glutamylcyclotransferase family protein [Halomonadaceae]|uniref:gamma-glutamylcyclotransferase family protein n=1 Tax=Halomonadaceae TaxID=28256 RepID=UPI001598CF05|nr:MULTISPECIES: gamma-glutamylcyclotransferase family protein [Halomonas]QJQ96629.1 gamma-glutamylcyclotransferase [Halomonas sp. PA5]